MDLSAITGALSALTTVGDLAKTAIDARDASKKDAAVSQIARQLIELQQHLLTLQRVVIESQDELLRAKQESRDLKERLKERGNYALVQIAENRFAMQRKVQATLAADGGEVSTEPTHYLCQPCFHKGEPSVLQGGERFGTWVWLCPLCKNEF